MHKIVYYPLGNAETLRIDVDSSDRKILMDYADVRDPNNKFDLRWDLPTDLKADLKASKRDSYDAVVFTHLDDDHCCGAGDFFYFEYASTRQGAGRVKMPEMWVPALAITETSLDGDALIISKEARYRLKELKGKGIRVFSAPETLEKWFKDNDLDLADYRDRGIVLDAGKVVPTFNLEDDHVEFFIHSPFASRTEDGVLHVRNIDAIVMQAVFESAGVETKLLITADVPYSQLDEIVRVTKLKKREHRLESDIFDVVHHCSYTALGPEKGKDKTKPTENIQWLLDQIRTGGLLVSSSKPIPTDDSDDQPPHRQAAATYGETADGIDGEFVVTMEHPKKSAPEPVVIEIDKQGAKLVKQILGAAAAVVSAPAARVG